MIVVSRTPFFFFLNLGTHSFAVYYRRIKCVDSSRRGAVLYSITDLLKHYSLSIIVLKFIVDEISESNHSFNVRINWRYVLVLYGLGDMQESKVRVNCFLLNLSLIFNFFFFKISSKELLNMHVPFFSLTGGKNELFKRKWLTVILFSCITPQESTKQKYTCNVCIKSFSCQFFEATFKQHACLSEIFFRAPSTSTILIFILFYYYYFFFPNALWMHFSTFLFFYN